MKKKIKDMTLSELHSCILREGIARGICPSHIMNPENVKRFLLDYEDKEMEVNESNND